MSGLSLNMGHSHREHESSTLGDIVREAYRFAHEGKYSVEHLVRSPANGYEQVKAPEFFGRFAQNNYVVKQEHLPFDPYVKAVMLRHGSVYVETGRVDFEQLHEKLEDASIPVVARGKTLYDSDGNMIVKTRTQNMGTFEKKDMRTVLRILPLYLSQEWEDALSVIDTLDSMNCYISDSAIESLATFSGTPRMELRQEMRLMQEMQQIQVPKLCAQMIQTATLYPGMREQLNMLKMNTQDLHKHVRTQIEKNPLLESDNREEGST